ncbi:alkaline ceramidase isoform X2 [Calliphora vicina]|uniref:alkaline ceramidase isoform X2 n=1 Tax=Calliphora vicina TaxID=7373 RepID=UPI00325AA4F5
MAWEHLRPGSSPVDWCEGNYLISANIAEFVNTISNFLFLLLPPVLMYLFKEYGRFVTQGIHVLWALLIIVGLSSMYFHATLSLIGQLLDELAILWVFMAAYSLFCPKKYFPRFCKSNRVQDQRVYRLGLRSTAVWLIAVICWINDRMFCDVWSSISFPYLHGFWHVFIFIAAYTVLVVYAYFYVENELPQRRPLLKYWPVNDFELGIPFISIRNPGKEFTNNI